MQRFNGLPSGAADGQPVAQPEPVGGGNPYPNYRWPPTYAPRPTGTYAGGPPPYRTAGPPARRKKAALSVTSLICGVAGVVLGFGAQMPLLLVILEIDQWPRWIIGTLNAAGTVGDGAAVLLGVVGVVTGVVALVQIRRSGGRKVGGWMAVTGICSAGVVLSLAAFVLLLALVMGGS